MREITQKEGNYMATYYVDDNDNITATFRSQISNDPIAYDEPPQTIRETMNEIEVAVIAEIVKYFCDHPSEGSVAKCAADLGYSPETVLGVVQAMNRTPGVTVLADKVTPAIKDALATADPGVGTKPIRTLAGAERDGKVHLPTLADIEVRGREESAEAALKLSDAKEEGSPIRIDPDESIELDHEQVDAFLFLWGKVLQSLATDYDYANDEAADKAWSFIEDHKKALQFLCQYAGEVRDIIEFEESEE